MAIERSVEESNEMGEVSSEMEMEGEELPFSLLGGQEVAPGDVVRITVVSVDPESGVWRGKYSTGAPAKSAIDETAEEIVTEGGM